MHPEPDTLDLDGEIAAAAAELVPLLYQDLHRVAHGVRRGQRQDHTLQTTALVHEAFLKMERTPRWLNRAHFLRAAAMAMRQVLVDDARSRLSLRRGEGVAVLPIDDITPEPAVVEDESIVALHEALSKLATHADCWGSGRFMASSSKASIWDQRRRVGSFTTPPGTQGDSR